MSTIPLKSLVSDPEVLRRLLEGSGISAPEEEGEIFAAWESSRRFLSELIPRSGTLLDYGCANGFLLRCLQEWCPHTIVPYGIDIDAGRIHEARRMFADVPENFCLVSPDDIVREGGFPREFDLVYWAVGDNVDFSEAANQRWLRTIYELTAPGGRFVMGFYQSAEANQAKLAVLSALGMTFAEVVQNPSSSDELAAWIDA
ncbi:class I SAM-dependent methyltransferase [Gordonia alkanivorans]|uniref:class I SAM-dependent methyltransferase n=1 Tax=Gordonia alkanivorans TaxID=84096 RepID=UPI001F4E3B91|nr:methyltransferase domain-containing protein [Gordonia alkanivorans]